MDRKKGQAAKQGAEYFADELPSGARSGGEPMNPADGSSGLLDEVVRQTLLSQDELLRMDHRERAALLKTAQQLDEQGADQQMIAVELARSLVSTRFPALARHPNRLQEVADFIADELLETPAARERLDRLWQQLRKGNQ